MERQMTKPDRQAERLEAMINAVMEDCAYKFGPISVRRMTAHQPKREDVWCATDANGRRSVAGIDTPADSFVRKLHCHHKHRIPLDHETRRVREMMKDAFEDLTASRIDVAYADSMDGDRNSFLCYQVDLDLLTPALAWRRHRIDWRPYSSAGESLIRILVHQRRRLKALGGLDGERRDTLKCCPVLACKIAEVENPASWHDMVENALADVSTRDMPHFREGVLADVIEFKKSVRWVDGKLTVYENLPDTLVASLPGKHLSAVLQHPWIPNDALIKSTKRKGKSVVITTNVQPVPILPVVDELRKRAGKDAGSMPARWKW